MQCTYRWRVTNTKKKSTKRPRLNCWAPWATWQQRIRCGVSSLVVGGIKSSSLIHWRTYYVLYSTHFTAQIITKTQINLIFYCRQNGQLIQNQGLGRHSVKMSAESATNSILYLMKISLFHWFLLPFPHVARSLGRYIKRGTRYILKFSFTTLMN